MRVSFRQAALISGVQAAILSACAEGPGVANETPVDPQAGRYSIAFSGGLGPVKAAENDRKESICVREGERNAFPHRLAKDLYTIHGSCAPENEMREGNKISGEITCLADPKLANGFTHFLYTGAVFEDRVELAMRIKADAVVKTETMSKKEARQLKLGMAMIEQARWKVEAVRVSDCG